MYKNVKIHQNNIEVYFYVEKDFDFGNINYDNDYRNESILYK